MCKIDRCVCTTRRNPEALPASDHRPMGTNSDRAYRKALGISGDLPASLGTISHGGAVSARRAAARYNRVRSS
jgi:hypothetical protein